MRKLFIILTLIFSSNSKSDSITKHCYIVPSDEENLYGVLEKQTYAGLPNYESVENGDIPETVTVIRLNDPMCFMFPERNYETIHIKSVQVVDVNKIINTVENQKIKVSGRLFEAETGHHHTEVLIEVTNASKTL